MNDNCPDQDDGKDEKKGKGDSSKKGESKATDKELLKIISDGSDFGKIEKALDEANSEWKKRRTVKQEFDRAKKAKKESQKKQNKKEVNFLVIQKL